MFKGVVPTVKISNTKQAEENMQAVGWRPTDEEPQRIDFVSLVGKATPCGSNLRWIYVISSFSFIL